MSVLHAKQRNALRDSTFGLPKSRKYPMEDKTHARVAESYASKEHNLGKLSGSQLRQIDAKAKRVLGK